MNPPKKWVRVVQHFTPEKLAESRSLPIEARLRWLENAQKLLYQAYVSSGATEPYDPKSWPYVKD